MLECLNKLSMVARKNKKDAEREKNESRREEKKRLWLELPELLDSLTSWSLCFD